jgi:uncharacterized membrane protein YqiK
VSNQSSTPTLLALALILAVGIICALIVGFLSWVGGANPANAVLRGGGALGGALALGIALVAALGIL